ncbi:MAG: DinB family protein, partial [Segetibacter sp.]|nr:DinB family protein [Segetibacter sp.]
QQQTESCLQKAVSKWQMTTPSKLLRQPGEKKWSLAQCLEHLNSYGHYYLPAMEKAIETAKQKGWSSQEKYTPGWLGDYFTKLMMPGTDEKKMKKMSAPANHSPVASLDSDKVLSEFIDQQEKLVSLLEQARKINLEKAKVSISIAKFIKLKLGDTFRFIIMHNYRHVLQAERALESAEKREESSVFN